MGKISWTHSMFFLISDVNSDVFSGSVMSAILTSFFCLYFLFTGTWIRIYFPAQNHLKIWGTVSRLTVYVRF